MGNLSNAQEADVTAANKAVGVLRETVAASPDMRAKGVLAEAHFLYWPGYDGGINKVAHSFHELPFKRDHVITFYRGFSELADANSKSISSSYNFTISKRGPTYALFQAAHELGHGVLGHSGGIPSASEENATHRYAKN